MKGNYFRRRAFVWQGKKREGSRGKIEEQKKSPTGKNSQDGIVPKHFYLIAAFISMSNYWLQVSLACLLFFSFGASFSEEFSEEPSATEPSLAVEEGHSINFNDVPVIEFIRFVSRICNVNFIFNSQDLQFHVTLASGKSVGPETILKALIQMLRVHGLGVTEQNGYLVIHHLGGTSVRTDGGKATFIETSELRQKWAVKEGTDEFGFYVYKLQYHQGSEIEESLKKIAGDLRSRPDTPQRLLEAIHSIQWVKATNSLLCSGDEETLYSLKKLIENLDVPLRQVFIEVLVIETDVRKSSEFGLQWAAGGEHNGKIGFGMGNFPGRAPSAPFARTMQGINPQAPPAGLGQFPIGRGFDAGVIGDILTHKGKGYLSLGALVSALQLDGDSTIVLNQKIITQDNKNSKIFVGDNIPFTGSVVQTIGQAQQTTANVEYRDVGVSLSITPRLGEGDVITLDLDEEITESVNDYHESSDNTAVSGIRTTKTNMATSVHVPDRHFLVLSGMIRNAKSNRKSGVPCLGGLPGIGAAFSKTKRHDEKRNIIIFVRPHIIRSVEDFKNLTLSQEVLYQSQAPSEDFAEGIQLVAPIE